VRVPKTDDASEEQQPWAGQAASLSSIIVLSQVVIWFQLAGIGDANP